MNLEEVKEIAKDLAWYLAIGTIGIGWFYTMSVVYEDLDLYTAVWLYLLS